MWELTLAILIVLASLAAIMFAIWFFFQIIRAEIRERRRRQELQRQIAADDLRDTILKLAHELAQSQRDSTQMLIKAAGEHSQHLRRNL